jgi:hypothetical protein
LSEERAVVTGRGDLELDDVVAALDQLYSDAQFQPDMKLLWDLRDARTAVTAGDVRSIVHFVSQHREARGEGKSAVVMGRDVDYGMARVAQVHLEPLGIELAVFRELEEAEQWLESGNDESELPSPLAWPSGNDVVGG